MTKYFKELYNSLSNLEVRDNKARLLNFQKCILKIVKLIISQHKKGNKLIFIGNGGSASIASHIATDFLKNAKIPAITFNDVSLITCISNDLGYENVFQKPLDLLAKKGDILVSISSSGKSQNILNATKAARNKKCFIITLSGFSKKNPLRKLGDINFYIPSYSYGVVEIAHLSICHCIVDTIIPNRKTKWTDSK